MEALTKLTDLTMVGNETPGTFNLSPSEPPRASLSANTTRLEAGVWASTLPSFFNLRNHPLSKLERDSIGAHDFAPELEIVQQILRRSLLLSLNSHAELSPATLDANQDTVAFDASFGEARSITASRFSARTGHTLSHTFSYLWRTGATLSASKVDLRAWTSFSHVVRQELAQSHAIVDLERWTHALILRRHQLEIQKLIERIAPAQLAADMYSILRQLSQILEQLRFVEVLLQQDHPLKQTLAIFTLVHEEARALIEFIEKRVLATKEIEEAVFEALDSTVYAVGMELLKVYSQELVGLASLRHAPAIYTKVENAHGLLRDGFQQTTVALAQLFDPSLDGSRLFLSFHTKLEQSLALRRELWTLLQLVRQAEKERDRRPLAPLLARLEDFRENSQRFLMYKDWESFERFMAEVNAARGAVELTPVLHRFGTYLEALFGQINMRAVLADQPFDYPTIVE